MYFLNLHQDFFNSGLIEESFDIFFRRYNSGLKEADRDEFFAFSQSFSTLREVLFSEIAKQRFKFSPPKKVTVYLNKPRQVAVFPWPERFILFHLAEVFRRTLTPQLCDSLMSYRPGFSQQGALKRAGDFIRNQKGPLFVARRDIKNFTDTLDWELLKDKFSSQPGMSAPILRLIEESAQREGDKLVLPMGIHLTLLAGSIYLTDIDRALEEILGSLYIRYGDDLLFITSDELSFKKGTSILDKVVSEKKLVWNEKKCFDLFLSSHADEGVSDLVSKNYFEYLGYKISRDGRVFLTAKKREACRTFVRNRLGARSYTLLRTLVTERRIAALCLGAATLFESKLKYNGNLIQEYFGATVDDEELRQFDVWLATYILKKGLGRGFKRSNFRHFPLRKLRALGLPSLVHLRRTGRI